MLSGTDSDGAIGIKHVKEQGGITIAQDPTEAEFDGMPRAAIETGMVDWILPVGAMPPHLMRFLHNENRIHVPPEDIAESEPFAEDEAESDGALTVAQIPGTTDEEALVEVLRFLWGQTGHDFAHYKRAAILRRIARRLQVNLLEDIASYLVFLRTHPDEVAALLHDLLISVTNFFRDPDAWAALEAYIAQLFAGKQLSNQVRVWVVACATGEEAYSIAMLLSEHAARLERPPTIQVVATDLDEDVIQIARAGVYPTTIEADVSQERLRRFFQKDHGRYRIKKELRELVLFASHDVLKDPHFSRLDLITCRNLLIYLKREAQENILRLFHFALRPGGLLFLGGAESIEEAHALFAPLDKHNRLYIRRTILRQNWQIPILPVPSVLSQAQTLPALPSPQTPINGGPVPASPPPSAAVPVSPPTARRTPLFGDLHLALLEKFAPPSVVINADYDIVHLTEHARDYLQLAAGEPSLNLLKVVHPALRIELHTALFNAKKSGANVTVSHVPFELNGAPRLVDIHVRPVRTPDAAESFSLIVFELAAESASLPMAVLPTPEPITHLLEDENLYLKEQLSATIEQYETSLEELKASNEEMLAINEEMRSASEELEASKEELQSINEELITVNQELKNNVVELSRANNDLQNLMASTEIGTIFLDRQLCIMRFTPSVQELFNLIPADLGRPLSDITHKLNYAELTRDAERVLQDLAIREREVLSDGRWYLGRMLPYRTLDDHIEGVVLTFVDISVRKRAEEARIALERELGVVTERNRLAQELHDSLSQGFIAIKLQIDVAETALPDDLSEVRQHLGRARELALQSLEESRRSVHGLYSQLIEQGSLALTLERLAQRASNGIMIKFLTTGTVYNLPLEVESNLYRVAQEAITNALRHALPKHILLELHYTPDQVRLRVHDDGQGFDTRARTAGIGITGMHERAAQIGGVLNVASQPGEGTEIVLTLETSTR